MNAAFSEIQDGAFSHLPLLQFLYGQGLAEGQGRAGDGKDLRLGGGERRVILSCLWRSRCRCPLLSLQWESHKQ